MNSEESYHLRDRAFSRAAILVLLFAALLGTWAALYWAESLFTEAHLVGYSCCVAEEDLPARGTPARATSDFFRTSPGKHLLPLILVSVSAAIFMMRMTKAQAKHRLPLLFVILNLLYLVADFGLVGISWRLSDQLNGPRGSPYAGYARTWYGLAFHGALWLIYFGSLCISSVPRAGRGQDAARL